MKGSYSGYYTLKKALIFLCISGDSGPGTTNNVIADLSSPSAQIDSLQLDPIYSGADL